MSEAQRDVVGSPPANVLEVRTVYRNVVIGTRHISASRRRLSPRGRKRSGFRIGVGAGIDAPVAAAFVSSPSHLLVRATDGDPEIHVTPQMTGEVSLGDQTCSLASFVEQRGPRFVLPAAGQATLRCGEVTFVLARTALPPPMAARAFVWRWSEMIYPVGVAAVVGLFLLMIFAVPGDTSALSADHLRIDHRLISFRIKPPEEIAVVAAGSKAAPPAAGSSGKPSAGPEGQVGSTAAKSREGLITIKGPRDNRDLRLGKERAIEQAKTSGILGILARADGAHLASIFGDEAPLGNAAADVLGNLVGTQIVDAYGIGGVGVVGTGEGAAGTGEATIGGAPGLNTIGGLRGIGGGPDRGRSVGILRTHRKIAPEFIPGLPTVRGSLDKEVIRRIVRRHLNEVKYCYELELARAPGLAGRVVVQFAIAPGGQVITSALASSTMGNARVENCTVQAVRRWLFPAPAGGGLVMVTYPFVLNPAGGQ